jgi:hypothetical protein
MDTRDQDDGSITAELSARITRWPGQSHGGGLAGSRQRPGRDTTADGDYVINEAPQQAEQEPGGILGKNMVTLWRSV